MLSKFFILSFLMILQEAAANPLCGRQELRDLLVCEMQRLVKYPLLIENLLRHTSRAYFPIF